MGRGGGPPERVAMRDQNPPKEICPLGLRVQYMHIYMCAYTFVCGRVCRCASRRVVCACVRLQGRKHHFVPSVLSMLHQSGLVTDNTYFFLKRNIEDIQKLLQYKKVCVCVYIFIYIDIPRNSGSPEGMPSPASREVPTRARVARRFTRSLGSCMAHNGIVGTVRSVDGARLPGGVRLCAGPAASASGPPGVLPSSSGAGGGQPRRRELLYKNIFGL